MNKKYVLQHLTDRCGRVFFPTDDEEEENQREEYFDSYEEALRRLKGLQKTGVYSTITELHTEHSVSGNSEKASD